jgi:uncharacterized protein (TIGR02466 family)
VASKKPAPKKSKKQAAKQPPFGLHTVFPTNVLLRDWVDREAMNKDLKEQIWRQRALDPEGIYRSNKAGTWHSNDAILETTGPSGAMLKMMFGEAFKTWGETMGLKVEEGEGVKLRLQGWAMIYSDRGYAAVHTHPNCHVSGVYYVDNTSQEQEQIMATGVPVLAGDIEFVDTRRGGGHQLSQIRLNPSAIFGYKTGRMVTFPSDLPHYVHPIVGPGERIAVACNGTFLFDKETKK